MNRILLIDDEQGVQDLWKTFHAVAEPTFGGQCRLDMASSLEQGIEKIAEAKYDVVILDLGLPPLTFDQVMDWLMHNAIILPPIIVLTGREDNNTRLRAMNAGAAQFFTKTDAHKFPNLFFKILYNEHLKRIYANPHSTI